MERERGRGAPTFAKRASAGVAPVPMSAPAASVAATKERREMDPESSSDMLVVNCAMEAPEAEDGEEGAAKAPTPSSVRAYLQVGLTMASFVTCITDLPIFMESVVPDILPESAIAPMLSV